MDFRLLPKVELHVHLDCSLSYQVAQQLQPGLSQAKFRSSFIAPAKCKDLPDYLLRARSGVALMQTSESLKAVTRDLFDQLSDEHVVYAEIRFAPLLHTAEGLHAKEVVRIVSQAAAEAATHTGIHFGLILCTLRQFSREQSLQTVQLVRQYKDWNIVGFDIAGDEAGYSIKEHMDAFVYAHDQELNITAHAGEACGPESMWETIRHFKPSRIGHGVRCIEDPKLMERIIADHIHLEICPTSNVQTNVCNEISDHPLRIISDSDISFSVSTDARTISDTTLANEYQLLSDSFGFDATRFFQLNLEALKHAFQPASKKSELIASFEKMYRRQLEKGID